jgi:bifunctional DNA-binding transcriptional regulator/antitoxin component of YhaV-PrlF toxin-antitoxin module
MTVPTQDPIHTKLGLGRRLAIPVELCQRYGFEPGKPLVLEATADGLMVRPLDRVLDEVQGFFAALAPRDLLLSDELRRDRRDEAARE